MCLCIWSWIDGLYEARITRNWIFKACEKYKELHGVSYQLTSTHSTSQDNDVCKASVYLILAPLSTPSPVEKETTPILSR
jgi:hypothetical protein